MQHSLVNWARLAVCASLGVCRSTAAVEDAAGGVRAPHHLGRDEMAAIDSAIRKASDWLIQLQGADGAFRPAKRKDVCPVALTALALWSLSEPGSERSSLTIEQGRRAAEFLARNRHADGGIYGTGSGLGVYTSGVAARALRSFSAREDSPRIQGMLPALELFVYRSRVPESLAEPAADRSGAVAGGQLAARAILMEKRDLSAPEESALEFLSRLKAGDTRAAPLRARVPGWQGGRRSDMGPFGYEDLLPFIYQTVQPDHQVALRALAAIKKHYTLERNPDLTKRYGEYGFVPGTQGLYYYYLTLARTLSLFGAPVLETEAGSRVDWVRGVSGKLLGLQEAGGAWVNTDGSWWEDEPGIVTAYALLTLSSCRGIRAAPSSR